MEVKTKKTRWYRGVSELFSGVDVEANFYNGIHVKASCVAGGHWPRPKWELLSMWPRPRWHFAADRPQHM